MRSENPNTEGGGGGGYVSRIGRSIGKSMVNNWPRWVVIIGGALLILALSHGAQAGEATLTWTNPTQNTDGSAIPASGPGSLTATRVEYGSCAGLSFGTVAGEVVVNQPATSTVIQNLAVGTHCFRVFARNTYGIESGPSNVDSKTFAPPTPNPPVLTVAAGATAYEIQLLGNGQVKLGRNVGTVTMDGACGSEFVTGYYAVAGEYVDYYRTPKSSIVVAECTGRDPTGHRHRAGAVHRGLRDLAAERNALARP